MIPKKHRKKTENSEKLQANQEVNIKAEKSCAQKNHVDRKPSNHTKSHEQHKSHSQPTNCISSLGRESLSSRANRRCSAKKVLPPLQWSPPNDVWKKLVKRQKAEHSEQKEVTIEPDVLKFKHLCRRNDRETGNLFRAYSMQYINIFYSSLCSLFLMHAVFLGFLRLLKILRYPRKSELF